MAKLRGIALALIVAGAIFTRTGSAGEAPDAGALHHARLMSLSLRIAQAEGNERKIRKYKSFTRQHRVRKILPAPFNPPGTRALRPGKRP